MFVQLGCEGGLLRLLNRQIPFCRASVLCCFHIVTSSVRYESTGSQQNESICFMQ